MTLLEFFFSVFVLWVVSLAGGWAILRIFSKHITEGKVMIESIDNRLRLIQKETHQMYVIRKAMQRDAENK